MNVLYQTERVRDTTTHVVEEAVRDGSGRVTSIAYRVVVRNERTNEEYLSWLVATLDRARAEADGIHDTAVVLERMAMRLRRPASAPGVALVESSETDTPYERNPERLMTGQGRVESLGRNDEGAGDQPRTETREIGKGGF